MRLQKLLSRLQSSLFASEVLCKGKKCKKQKQKQNKTKQKKTKQNKTNKQTNKTKSYFQTIHHSPFWVELCIVQSNSSVIWLLAQGRSLTSVGYVISTLANWCNHSSITPTANVYFHLFVNTMYFVGTSWCWKWHGLSGISDAVFGAIYLVWSTTRDHHSNRLWSTRSRMLWLL